MARTMQTGPDPHSRRRRSGLRVEAPSRPLSRYARKQAVPTHASGDPASSVNSSGGPGMSTADKKRPAGTGISIALSSARSNDLSEVESDRGRQPPQRSMASNVDGDNREEGDGDDVGDMQSPLRKQSGRKQVSHLGSLSKSNGRQTSGKTISTLLKYRRVLRAVKTAARRQRRPGFFASTTAGVTSEEDQDGQQPELASADDVDDDTDNNGRDGRLPRTRSVSIAGYTWKSQEVTIRAATVVNALSYHRARRIELRLDKRRYSGNLTETDDGDYTDTADPNFFFRGLKFKRGQLVYILPDPAWLEERAAEEDPLTVENLEAEEWWLAVVLDCAELKYRDGSTACILRVAWCYSADQAKALFSSDPDSQWAKLLEKHSFWDNELVASDHVDFVSAESSGGLYKGGLDQNALETAIQKENEEKYGKAYDAYKMKYRNVPKKNRPTFRPPKLKKLPRKAEKVCLRLMIRGLEQSDVERCIPPKQTSKGLLSRKWVEEIKEPRLDRFAEDWAVQLSHETRCKLFNISTQTARRTIAAQDRRTRKQSQLDDLEYCTSGYGGKGKGRGKTVLSFDP